MWRLRSAINEFGGAILCDPVGTGKTFVGIAVAPENTEIVVVAPAVLREMWTDALRLCERTADFLSIEYLSRCSTLHSSYGFVIVDEAHHARNPLTKRFRALSRLVAGTQVLLLTATPIHNRKSDLTALISLFHGERAESLDSAELARILLRRDDLSKSIPGMPRTQPLTRLRVRENQRIPELLLSLPPPLPVRDGSDGGALIAHSLIREWASSDAALIGGLRRRIVRAESLSAALADGTWPSRAELRSWIAGDNEVQLGFAGLLAPLASNTAEMLRIVTAHSDALRSVLDVARSSQSDSERAALIRQVRRDHPGSRIVAFSQYADTVDGVFRIISCDGKVGALSGSRARVAGGPITRSDAIGAFAPLASRRKAPKTSDEITLLLTTDLLSEGVNLQDAGVVIHLDLPWTPARMEQRLGRIARVGSFHERVHSYAILPPVSAENAIRIETILRRKIEQSSMIVPDWPALAGFDFSAASASAPRVSEAVRSVLSLWSSKSCLPSARNVSAVNASTSGFLAVIEHRGFRHVVARLGASIGNDTTLILDSLKAIGTHEAFADADRIAECEKEVLDWFESHRALPALRKSPIRNRAAAKIKRIMSNARAFQRMRISEKAEKALSILGGNLGAWEELLIGSLVGVPDGEQFLDELLAIRSSSGDDRATGIPEVLAMLILVRE